MQRSRSALSAFPCHAGANTRAAILFCLLLLVVGCSNREEPGIFAPPQSGLYGEKGTIDPPIGDIPQVPGPGADEHGVNQYLRWLVMKESQGQGLSYFMVPDFMDFAALPKDPKNGINFNKFVLGMYLFMDPGLGVNPARPEGERTYSCGSCHPAQGSFYSNTAQGIGDGGIGFGTAGEARVVNPLYTSPNFPDATDLRVPSVVNAGYQDVVMWDGKFGSGGPNVGTESQWTGLLASNNLGLQGVESQAHGAIVRHRLGKDLVEINPEYVGSFFFSFPPTGAPVNRVSIARAIAAYERSIVTDRAPFQRWLRGDNDAMTYGEKRGAILFFGEAGCVRCHTGPALNSMTFHALGFNDLDGSWNPGAVDLSAFGGTVDPNVRKGRGGFTQNPADDYKFKTPGLYNLKENPFLGHGSSFQNIREVIEYINRGVKQNPIVPDGQLAAEFTPLGLNEREITALTDFVTNALYDPDMMRYNADHVPISSSLCAFPSADTQSLIDLGCDPPLTLATALKPPTLPPSRRQITRR